MDDVDKLWELWSGLPASPQAWTNWKPSITAAKQPVDEQGQQWGHYLYTCSTYGWQATDFRCHGWLHAAILLTHTHTHTHTMWNAQTTSTHFETDVKHGYFVHPFWYLLVSVLQAEQANHQAPGKLAQIFNRFESQKRLVDQAWNRKRHVVMIVRRHRRTAFSVCVRGCASLFAWCGICHSPHSLRVTFSISNSKHVVFFASFMRHHVFFQVFMRHVLYKTSWSSFQSTNSWFSKVNVLCDRLQG